MAKAKLNIVEVGGNMTVTEATKVSSSVEEYTFREVFEAFNVLSRVSEEFSQRADTVLSRLQSVGVSELTAQGVDGLTTRYLDSVLTVKTEEVEEFILDDLKLKSSPTAKSFVKIVQTLDRRGIKKAYKAGALMPADMAAVSVNTVRLIKMRRVNVGGVDR